MMQHTFVLSRRVGREQQSAELALPALAEQAHSGLVFTGPFERRSLTGPWGNGPAERQAHATLRTGRTTVERVEVEVGPWSRHAVELRLRPLVRRPERWSGRRQARYFQRAHEAIDALARAVELSTPPPVAVPATRSA